MDYQTAVAQAEMEDRERPGAYHRLRFDDLEIETTRPELVAACVALVAHPDDERFSARFGTPSARRSSGSRSRSWPMSWPIPRRAPASP